MLLLGDRISGFQHLPRLVLEGEAGQDCLQGHLSPYKIPWKYCCLCNLLSAPFEAGAVNNLTAWQRSRGGSVPVWPCWQCDRHCSCVPSFSLCSSEWPWHLCEAGSPLCPAGPATPPQPHRDAAEPDLNSGPASSAVAMPGVNAVPLSAQASFRPRNISLKYSMAGR